MPDYVVTVKITLKAPSEDAAVDAVLAHIALDGSLDSAIVQAEVSEGADD